MKTEGEKNKVDLTTQGALVVSMSKALFNRDIDGVFDILGGYMDDNDLKVSAGLLTDYEKAGRINHTRKVCLPTEHS